MSSTTIKLNVESQLIYNIHIIIVNQKIDKGKYSIISVCLLSKRNYNNQGEQDADFTQVLFTCKSDWKLLFSWSLSYAIFAYKNLTFFLCYINTHINIRSLYYK